MNLSFDLFNIYLLKQFLVTAVLAWVEWLQYKENYSLFL